MPDRPPSLRDFDYFDEVSARSLADADAVDDELVAEVAAEERRRGRSIRALLLSVTFFLAAIWLFSGYADWIRYAFSPEREPISLGDIVDVAKARLAHNAYVEVEGITLHRGLAQKLVRGIGVVQSQYHYFELSGSGGVFIEVAPDRGIETHTAVKVAGRVVDPKQDGTYSPLLREYENRFHQGRRPNERIIQVGVVPGAGRERAFAAFGLLGAIALLNLFTLWRFFATRR